MRRKKKIYPDGYAKDQYEKINGKTFCWFAIFSVAVFLVLIGYFIYRNYTFQYPAILEVSYNAYIVYLLPYSDLFCSLLVSITCFTALSICTIIYKKSLIKELPQDYFLEIQQEKQAEEKSNKKILERIHLLSARKKNKSFFFVIGFCISTIVFFLLFLIYILGEKNFSYIEIGVGILISLLLGATLCFLLFVKNSSDLENLQWQVSVNSIEEKTSVIEIRDKTQSDLIKNSSDAQMLKQNEDFLTNLFQTNHRYSIAYNELTKKQADKSFWLAVFTSIVGVLLIVLGVILLFANEITPTYVATAGGVLTEIISAIFLYFHTNTIKNMSKYHNKLLLSQNISIALKVTDKLPLEIQNSIRAKLVEQLVSDINKYISCENE